MTDASDVKSEVLRWPDGEGEPHACCDRCMRRAWCWMMPGAYRQGFICEACAIELGLWPPSDIAARPPDSSP